MVIYMTGESYLFIMFGWNKCPWFSSKSVSYYTSAGFLKESISWWVDEKAVVKPSFRSPSFAWLDRYCIFYVELRLILYSRQLFFWERWSNESRILLLGGNSMRCFYYTWTMHTATLQEAKIRRLSLIKQPNKAINQHSVHIRPITMNTRIIRIKATMMSPKINARRNTVRRTCLH